MKLTAETLKRMIREELENVKTNEGIKMPRIKADPGYSEKGHSDEYKLERAKEKAEVEIMKLAKSELLSPEEISDALKMIRSGQMDASQMRDLVRRMNIQAQSSYYEPNYQR